MLLFYCSNSSLQSSDGVCVYEACVDMEGMVVTEIEAEGVSLTTTEGDEDMHDYYNQPETLLEEEENIMEAPSGEIPGGGLDEAHAGDGVQSGVLGAQSGAKGEDIQKEGLGEGPQEGNVMGGGTMTEEELDMLIASVQAGLTAGGTGASGEPSTGGSSGGM